MDSPLDDADFHAWANEQPALQGHSWRLSIANTRDRLAEATETVFRYARRDAAIETGMPEEVFPADCPWSFAQIMDGAFWPE